MRLRCYLRIPTLRTLLLPALTLSALYVAYVARLTRSGLVKTLKQDYIRTARAKGLSEWRVVTVHALRGAILPVVSFSGPALAFLLTGTVVVERMFAIPGLGAYFIDAANNRDHRERKSKFYRPSRHGRFCAPQTRTETAHWSRWR